MTRARHAAAALVLAWCVLTAGARPAHGAPLEVALERARMAIGESTTLVVTVEGSGESPRFDLPDGLGVLATGRQQQFSWVNGKSSNITSYRYEIGATAAGSYAIGPVHVHTPNGDLQSGTVTLEVTRSPEHVGGPNRPAGAATEPASLTVTVEPQSPYVGQPVMLRVRLLQRVAFTEDPQYTPPSATGFWTEKSSAPESYYADDRGRRVLVTETRMRMFPLAAGRATVGEALAQVGVAGNDPSDPLSWLRGGGRREYTLRSRPVGITVRPLPPGAPTGFGGAVGAFDVHWDADRTTTPRDVPATVRLDVRGRGNLPLIQPPAFDPRNAEVFSQTSEDSLGPAGAEGPGRKRFQWTVLPRHEGTLTLEAPTFVALDPGTGGYRALGAPPITLEVTASAFAGGATGGGFPAEFIEHPVEADTHAVQPWGWVAAGGLLGLAIALWRASSARPAGAPERARALEWLRALGISEGPDFWRAAEDALGWLAARGEEVSGLRAEVSRARYAGTGADPSAVRRSLVERVARAMPAEPPVMAWRGAAVAVGLGAATLAAVLAFGPTAGPSPSRLAQADAAARHGDLEAAAALWTDAWRQGTHRPELAARLAWSAVQQGDLGGASVWVLRGRRLEPRDPALEWVAGRVRDAGGLLGAPRERLPVRAVEWGTLGALLAIAAGATWPRRRLAMALLALAVVAGAWPSTEGMIAHARSLAVMTRAVPVGGDALELQPGQVVKLIALDARGATIAAGRAARGTIAPDALQPVNEGR